MQTEYIDLKKGIDEGKMKNAACAIKNGELVLFPTETVYGLGANGLNEEAVKKIYIAKGRATDNPLILHISNIDMLKKLVENVNKTEEELIEKFWPGPLTIIFKKKPIVPNIITGGLDTVAIRMPQNEIARKLIEYSNAPIAAPSANISGRPSGTILQDIIEEFQGKVKYMIDGGKVDIGLESTVIRVIDKKIHILRPGKITKENLEELGYNVVVEKQILGEYDGKEKVLSPGIKYKHYAPSTKTVLVYSDENEKMVKKIKELASGKNVVILCKEKNQKEYEGIKTLNMGSTLEEISSNIFMLLREADKLGKEEILIEGVKAQGLGLAIMNRLIRASAHNYFKIW